MTNKSSNTNKTNKHFQAALNVGLEFDIPAAGQITSPFGSRFHPVLKVQQDHTGIDIGARPRGKETPILAAEDGKVIFSDVKGGYGNTVILDHGHGYTTRYAHLADGVMPKVGEEVKQGQTLAIMGTTGRSTGIHLHYEIRKDGVALDPNLFYPDINMKSLPMVKPSDESREKRKESEFLQKWHGIDENKPMESVAVDYKNGVPQFDLLKERGINVKKEYSKQVQQGAAYAFSKHDTFAALTFLSEGVDGRAFYADPANKHKLINMHIGITMNYQSPEERRKVLEAANLSHLESEVNRAINNKLGVTPELAKHTVSLKQVHDMFGVVRDKYTDVAERAILKNLKTNEFAQKMMKEDNLSEKEAQEAIINTMPAGTWAVLQHAAYKKGNLNSFDKVVQAAINATLDDKNRDQHLAKGAEHISYTFVHNGKRIHDTRVETLHRVFFVAGNDLSPELQMKIAKGEDLGMGDKAVEKVLKRANIPESAIKDNKFAIPEDSDEVIAAKQQGVKWEDAPAAPAKQTPAAAPKIDDWVGRVPQIQNPTQQPKIETPQKEREFNDPFNSFS